MSSLVTAAVRLVAGKITRSALLTRSSRPPASMVVLSFGAMAKFYASARPRGRTCGDALGRARRRRDSNPRQRLTPCNALAGRRLQPLGHFSDAPRIPAARIQGYVSLGAGAR